MRIPFDEINSRNLLHNLKNELKSAKQDMEVREEEKENKEKPKEHKPKTDERVKEAVIELGANMLQEVQSLGGKIQGISDDYQTKKRAFAGRPSQEKIISTMMDVYQGFLQNATQIVNNSANVT